MKPAVVRPPQKIWVGPPVQPGMLILNEPAEEEGMAKYLPLKEIYVDVTIQDSIAVIKMVQEYFNPGDNQDIDIDDVKEP